MENYEKMNKEELFRLAADMFNKIEVTEDQEDFISFMKDFLEKEADQVKRKNDKAKERAKKKRAESDKLKEKIYMVLTDEFQCISDIALQIEEEGITNAKVSNRLNKLEKEGFAEKKLITVGEGDKKRRVMGYCLIRERNDEEDIEMEENC